jgi:hypothetical protein
MVFIMGTLPQQYCGPADGLLRREASYCVACDKTKVGVMSQTNPVAT